MSLLLRAAERLLEYAAEGRRRGQVVDVALRSGVRLGVMATGRYEIIIYWSDEDQAFVAEVPELAGCAADGSTYQEALANAEIVIREWIETARELGRPIPEPKGRLVFA